MLVFGAVWCILSFEQCGVYLVWSSVVYACVWSSVVYAHVWSSVVYARVWSSVEFASVVSHQYVHMDAAAAVTRNASQLSSSTPHFAHVSLTAWHI